MLRHLESLITRVERVLDAAEQARKVTSSVLVATQAEPGYRLRRIAGTFTPAGGRPLSFRTVAASTDDGFLHAEATTRRAVDRRLEACGWVIQDKGIVGWTPEAERRSGTFGARAAIISDCAPYVDRQRAGVPEAKKDGTTLTEVGSRTLRYVQAPGAAPESLTPPPFGYEATINERRVTWSYDPRPRARELFAVFPFDTLAEWVHDIVADDEHSTLGQQLHELPSLEQGRLRDKEFIAIRNVRASEHVADPERTIRDHAVLWMLSGWNGAGVSTRDPRP